MAITPTPPPDCVTPEAGGRGVDLRCCLVWGSEIQGLGARWQQVAAAPLSLSECCWGQGCRGVPQHESRVWLRGHLSEEERKGSFWRRGAWEGLVWPVVSPLAVAWGLYGHRVDLRYAYRMLGAVSWGTHQRQLSMARYLLIWPMLNPIERVEICRSRACFWAPGS